MSAKPESPAVAVALAHIEAWSNHDYDSAQNALAPDVHVTATTTQPIMKPTDLTGADSYMIGLTQFAEAVTPGSLRVIASVGDEHNALVLVTVEANFGAGPAILPGARLYQIDDNSKIKQEQVIFYAAEG